MSPASEGTEFRRLVEAAADDDNVIGVVVGGSRGKAAYVTETSDWDVYLIVREPPADRRFTRGGELELVILTLDQLRGMPAWNRYAFAHVRPAIDKTCGELERVVTDLARVDPTSAGEPLDAYLNAYYRSLTNARLGLELESRFDAAESVPWLLEFLFAAHGRVRPYNKWLPWELREHPLEEPWTETELLPRLDRILSKGAVGEQRALFGLVEPFARGRGLGKVIDGWEPDVPFLRGEQ